MGTEARQDLSRGGQVSTPRCPTGSLGRALQVSLRGATSSSRSVLPGPFSGRGPLALQGLDHQETLLNACMASQCGRRCPNKVTVSGSCLCYSPWLRSRARTRCDAGQAAPLGLQGTWGQLARGPCSAERCQLGRALSVALGLTGPAGCRASPSHG